MTRVHSIVPFDGKIIRWMATDEKKITTGHSFERSRRFDWPNKQCDSLNFPSRPWSKIAVPRPTSRTRTWSKRYRPTTSWSRIVWKCVLRVTVTAIDCSSTFVDGNGEKIRVNTVLPHRGTSTTPNVHKWNFLTARRNALGPQCISTWDLWDEFSR